MFLKQPSFCEKKLNVNNNLIVLNEEYWTDHDDESLEIRIIVRWWWRWRSEEQFRSGRAKKIQQQWSCNRLNYIPNAI